MASRTLACKLPSNFHPSFSTGLPQFKSTSDFWTKHRAKLSYEISKFDFGWMDETPEGSLQERPTKKCSVFHSIHFLALGVL